MAQSVRERILALADRVREPVDVPEWAEAVGDAKLYIAAMSAADRDVWEAELVEKKMRGARALLHGFRAALVARCLVDENWQRIFTDDDVAALGAKSDKPLDRLFDVATRVNAIRPEDAEAVEKN